MKLSELRIKVKNFVNSYVFDVFNYIIAPILLIILVFGFIRLKWNSKDHNFIIPDDHPSNDYDWPFKGDDEDKFTWLDYFRTLFPIINEDEDIINVGESDEDEEEDEVKVEVKQPEPPPVLTPTQMLINFGSERDEFITPILTEEFETNNKDILYAIKLFWNDKTTTEFIKLRDVCMLDDEEDEEFEPGIFCKHDPDNQSHEYSSAIICLKELFEKVTMKILTCKRNLIKNIVKQNKRFKEINLHSIMGVLPKLDHVLQLFYENREILFLSAPEFGLNYSLFVYNGQEPQTKETARSTSVNLFPLTEENIHLIGNPCIVGWSKEGVTGVENGETSYRRIAIKVGYDKITRSETLGVSTVVIIPVIEWFDYTKAFDFQRMYFKFFEPKYLEMLKNEPMWDSETKTKIKLCF